MLDWRGWLGISDTALALLVALVTVIGATVPRVAELVVPRYSDVRLNYRQPVNVYLEMTALNQGNQDGEVVSAVLLGKDRSGRVLGSIKLEDATPPLAIHGQLTVSEFRLSPARVSEFLEWPQKDIQSATMLVSVVEFRKPEEQRPIEIPLADYRQFCEATEDADYNWRHPPTPGQAPQAPPQSHCR